MPATLNPNEMPYFEVHEGNGPHLLLQHGFLSSRAQWRPNLEALQAFCTPVVVELLGHGRSPAPTEDKPYEVASYVAAYEAIRREIGAERWFVCGQSFGAGLAIRYAMAYPQHTRGVVVTNSLSAFSKSGDAERRSLTEERIRNIEQDGRKALEALRIYPSHAKRLPEDAKVEMVADAAGISLSGVVKSWRVTAPELNMQEQLVKVPVPMLLVNGLWEKRFQPLCDESKALVPDLTLVELDGGHSINMEAAEGFNEAVRSFISRRS